MKTPKQVIGLRENVTLHGSFPNGSDSDALAIFKAEDYAVKVAYHCNHFAELQRSHEKLVEAIDAALRDLHCGTKDQAAATLRAVLSTATALQEKLKV